MTSHMDQRILLPGQTLEMKSPSDPACLIAERSQASNVQYSLHAVMAGASRSGPWGNQTGVYWRERREMVRSLPSSNLSTARRSRIGS
jgi:hypothetical protein